MTGFKGLTAVGMAMMMVACGGGSGAGGKGAIAPQDDSGRKSHGGQAVSKEAAAGFDAAIASFQANDKSSSWNDASCKSTADQFMKASDAQESDTGKPLAVAVYNAGLSYQRCGKDDEAQKAFQAAQNADASFHRAKAQLALYKYKKSGDLDEAIRELDQVIRDAKYQNVEALVSLAALQMQRGGTTSGAGCDDDLSCAKLNLQRALAIDDGFMPAANQLSVYYMEQAKAKAGGKKATGRKARRGALVVAGSEALDVNKQQLDLAALVASQGLQKNPSYAPLHNTVGLIMVQLKNYNGAVKSFGKASALDPKFFEAHMNYGAVNLTFRGFSEAEGAYRKALALRPKDFEAHLGLALAIRGQINDSNFDAAVKEAQEHLDECKKIAGDRPETYYNEAILTQEFRAKRAGDKPIPVLKKAANQYREFISKAGGDETFAEAVKRSKDRSQDIEDTIKFIEEGEEAKKNMPPPPPDPAAAAPAPAPAADAKGAAPKADAKAPAPKADPKKKP